MNKPIVSLIAAVARNSVIGIDNRLPWRLKADLARFKQLTRGHTIIMGRKTWESLGRLLPEREHCVITRNPDYAAAGISTFSSLAEALQERGGEVFIIGGAQIYAEALPIADRLYLTEVEAEVDGDAYFPPIDSRHYVEMSRTHHLADADNDHAFSFVDYHRR